MCVDSRIQMNWDVNPAVVVWKSVTTSMDFFFGKESMIVVIT